MKLWRTKALLLAAFVLLRSMFTLAQFPGITYRSIDVIRNCNYATTQYPSVSNTRYSMFNELFAIPAAVPVLTALPRIRLVNGPVEGGPPPLSVMTSQGVVIEEAIITESVVITIQPGEKSCDAHEYNKLVSLVALNNSAIDAVLTKYGVQLNQLTSPYAPIFPRQFQ